MTPARPSGSSLIPRLNHSAAPGASLASRGLRRPHPEGRKACRPAGRTANQVRTRHQHENRERARPHDPAVGAGAGGRDHPMTRRVPGGALLNFHQKGDTVAAPLHHTRQADSERAHRELPPPTPRRVPKRVVASIGPLAPAVKVSFLSRSAPPRDRAVAARGRPAWRGGDRVRRTLRPRPHPVGVGRAGGGQIRRRVGQTRGLTTAPIKAKANAWGA
jgi:hypothetical protein